MLKLRVLSALVILPLVVGGILYLPDIYVAIASGLVFALGAWEWLNMTVLKRSVAMRFILLFLLIIAAYSLLATGLNVAWVYWAALVWWIVGFIGICYYPNGANIWRAILLQPLIGLVLFVPGWLAFNQLHAQANNGPSLVLLGCCLIWGADIGAYFTGRAWGKAKLIEHVSPGKTWAGFYGALVAGVITMGIYYLLFKPSFSLLHAIWLALFTVIFSVIGDLVESLIKRVYGVKDSGKLIPGHGGAFDRIDSMLAAFPIYFLGITLIQNLQHSALIGG